MLFIAQGLNSTLQMDTAVILMSMLKTHRFDKTTYQCLFIAGSSYGDKIQNASLELLFS